jgi:hypothetical protein
MKNLFALFVMFYGILHLFGFIKAYFSIEMFREIIGVPKNLGKLWFLAFILFIIVAKALFNNKKWLLITVIAVSLSQYLIFMAWRDAKFGTIFNILILSVAIYDFTRKKLYLKNHKHH